MGVLTLRRAVLGKKTKFFQVSKDFAGNWETQEFSGRHEVMKLKFREVGDFLGKVFQKFGTKFHIFGRTFIYTWFSTNSIC